MQNEKVRVSVFSSELIAVEELAFMHRSISKDNSVGKALIYSDENFSQYLKHKLIPSDDQLVFLLLTENGVEGFCRLRRIGKVLFLNNIYINDSAQGSGLGKKLLSESIQKAITKWNSDFFELDVFQSNVKALNWYKNLGLTESSAVFWYKPKTVIGSFEHSKTIKRVKDANGFMNLFVDDVHVGSLINKQTVISNPDHLKYFAEDDTDHIFIKSNQAIENDNFSLLDISLRLRIPIMGIVEKLTY